MSEPNRLGPYVEIVEGKDNQHYVRKVEGRGNLPDEVVLSSEGYTSRATALERARDEFPGLDIYCEGTDEKLYDAHAIDETED